MPTPPERNSTAAVDIDLSCSGQYSIFSSRSIPIVFEAACHTERRHGHQYKHIGRWTQHRPRVQSRTQHISAVPLEQQQRVLAPELCTGWRSLACMQVVSTPTKTLSTTRADSPWGCSAVPTQAGSFKSQQGPLCTVSSTTAGRANKSMMHILNCRQYFATP